MQITGSNYIGQTPSARGDRKFKTFDPIRNTENPWPFVEASSEEIERAAALAKEAFKSYSQSSGEERSLFLETIADNLEAEKDLLIDTYCLESGLPQGRGAGELNRTLFQLRTFAALVRDGSWVEATIDQADPERSPVPKPDLRKMFEPIGPIVVFGASNFPFAYSTAGGDTAAALAAGCPVIVKSHPMHAATGELVAQGILKAAEACGMPDGVFSNLNSAGIEVGVQLVQDPRVKGVGFTGSIRGGRALMDLAANRPEPIPVFAEMGSVNPVLVLPGFLEGQVEHWAQTYAGSVNLGTGQFCTSPGLIFGLEGEEMESFAKHLGHHLAAAQAGVMLHPNIADNFEQGRQRALAQKGVELVEALDGQAAVNHAVQTAAKVSGEVFLKNPELHKEVFGPYTLVVMAKDLEELKTIIDGLEGQLTGTVLGDDDQLADYKELILGLKERVGRLIFNGVPTGVEVAPAMLHGGPYPASSDARFTAVGADSIKRWVRPVSYQNFPDEFLPDALKDENPLGIERRIDQVKTTKSIGR